MAEETTAAIAEPRVNRKGRTGTVVSDKGDKTVIVAVVSAKRHRLYRKVLRRTKHYAVHDPENRATTGDLVRIEECRPISKTKRWLLVSVLTEREVSDVDAAEIDTELVEEVQRAPSRPVEVEPAAAAAAETTDADEPATATEPPAAAAATETDKVEKAE
jgi:small subunit ribosomal protein S17